MTKPELESLDVVVIGAGFAGMYALHVFRDQRELSTVAFETGDSVGGTWYWNRYPGARCDVESLDYSYTFDPELYRGWSWSERFPTQPEIERYANYVADTLDLRPDIRFGTRVTAATWDENDARWLVETDRGDPVSCKYLVTGAGCLSARQVPNFSGIDRFEGETYHTGFWPKNGVDLTGKRVGLVGTGSSGVQSTPHLAAQAAHLTVFQRTPNFTLPACQTPLAPEAQASRKADLSEWRDRAWKSFSGVPVPFNDQSALEEGRDKAFSVFEGIWGRESGFALLRTYNDLTVSEDANEIVADFVRGKIRETVKDPKRAEMLCPTDHPLGSKRIILETDYLETFNRENVDLVDVRKVPIEEITATGLRLADGREFELDAIVFATGFDAMTGPLTRIDIRGRAGRKLKDAWAEEGPKTYLGLQVAGFPNLFTITGPGSPSVLCSMIFAIEHHVDWIADCVDFMRGRGIDTIEPTVEAQEAWAAHVTEVASHTLYPKANSWYMGANIPGKPRVMMPYVGGMPMYKAKCDEVIADGYYGFKLERRTAEPASQKT